uniref:RNA terminal phosphate cyclase like 1 n=1 Tax=Sciurus vulgaris TaxID=55149 RepID=A0A8D2E0Y4_SCIVU
MATQAHSLSYAGCNFLRQRLVLSTLSGRPVKIRKIRARDDNPGLRDFEASFIRLLDKITNGSRIEINQTGTTLYYQPGLLYGGSLEHDCSVLRGIGYYLEGLLCLAPFMKHPLKIVLRGVTNDQVDPSVSIEAKPWCDFSFVSHYNSMSEKKVSHVYSYSVFLLLFILRFRG